jgi:pimeloyl-ACP methyl ester carboxylesterase
MADGAAIAYRLWKPGPPRRLLALLHGVASNMTRWSEFVAQTSLGESWDILRVDLRGHGLSLRRGPLTMTVWCADLSTILRAEGYREAVIAGHCFGADIAAEFAVQRPEETAGLILIEPLFRSALVGGMCRLAQIRLACIALARIILALNAIGLHRRRLPPLDLETLDRQTRTLMAQVGSTEALASYASPLSDLRTTATAVYLQASSRSPGPCRTWERFAPLPSRWSPWAVASPILPSRTGSSESSRGCRSSAWRRSTGFPRSSPWPCARLSRAGASRSERARGQRCGATGERTCSGRTPMPMSRAGMRRRIG